MSQARPHVRPAVPTDHAFIYATYLRNRWFSEENTTTLKKSTWMRLQHERLEKMLSAQPVSVVCLPDDHDTILGYKLQDGQKLFSYVKAAWRDPRLGVTKALEEATL